MAKETIISKNQILKVALDVIAEKGLAGLNARIIANRLGCSVQPIYSQFENMMSLKKEMIKNAAMIFNAYINKARESMEDNYLWTGLNYVRFAEENPHLFSILFSVKTLESDTFELTNEDNKQFIYQVITQRTGLSLENTKNLHFDMWIFTHGLASLVLAKIIRYDENLIKDILAGQWMALERKYINEK